MSRLRPSAIPRLFSSQLEIVAPSQLRFPPITASMDKGGSLTSLLDDTAVRCLAHNLALAWPRFDAARFRRSARRELDALSIMQRGLHLARILRQHLPPRYEDAVAVLLRSLPPPDSATSDRGLGVFFFLPHTSFIALYGLDAEHNAGVDPFPVSMHAQYELTRRFTAEFSIRPFLIRWPERTLAQLLEWTRDPDPHVRRLCSEGSRPRLPWAQRIPAFVRDPRPTLPILEALKDDPSLYVRRSVANHIGDIAKNHPSLAFDLCQSWLKGAPPERKWLIRHAVRHPAKHAHPTALRLRRLAA